jgi:hypothetical protein
VEARTTFIMTIPRSVQKPRPIMLLNKKNVEQMEEEQMVADLSVGLYELSGICLKSESGNELGRAIKGGVLL